jgi:hypothetical protein
MLWLSNGTKSVTRDAMAFQWYQEWGKRHYGSGDLKVTNKTNKLPSFIDRLRWLPDSFFDS